MEITAMIEAHPAPDQLVLWRYWLVLQYSMIIRPGPFRKLSIRTNGNRMSYLAQER
jgi:hypothetical protein